MKAGFAWNSNFPWTTTKSNSAMVALQSRFPRDKLVLTAGYRRDRVEINEATLGAERLARATNLHLTRTYRFVNDTITRFKGNTRGLALPEVVASHGITLLSTDSRDASDFVGRGTEIDLTGRLARGWSISVNLSRNRLEQSKIATDVNSFLAAVRPDWETRRTTLNDTLAAVATFVRARDGTPQRDFVANPATFADVYAYSVSVIDVFNRGTGKAPFTHVGEMANAFTSYRFTVLPRMRRPSSSAHASASAPTTAVPP